MQQRSQERTRVGYPAWVERIGHFIPCTIADIAKHGAQLCIMPDIILPRRFNLWFTKVGDLKRLCRIAWRESDRVGVRFVSNE